MPIVKGGLNANIIEIYNLKLLLYISVRFKFSWFDRHKITFLRLHTTYDKKLDAFL